MPHADEGLRTWTVDEDPSEHGRLDAWSAALADALVRLRPATRQPARFGASLQSRTEGELTVARVFAGPHELLRGDRERMDGRRCVQFVTQLASPWSVRQDGRLLHLRAGDVVLLDASRTYSLHFPQACGSCWLQVPRPWAARWLQLGDTAGPRVAWRDEGWGRTLSALLQQVGEDLGQLEAYPDGRLAGHLGDLLTAAFEPRPRGPRAEENLMRRAEAALREQLDRPGLTAGRLAAQLGVSLRTLQRAFAAEGASVAGRLRSLRMEHALDLLAAPHLARLPVGEIAGRCGFRDASHFTREFRRAWGSGPAAWRAARAAQSRRDMSTHTSAG